MAGKGKGIAIVAVGGIALLAIARSAKAAKGVAKAPVQLSKNFNLAEFVEHPPQLKDYALSAQELENVTRLARNVLQPLRDKYGPTRINSGGRPPHWRYPAGATLDGKSIAGKSINEVLKLKGYQPSEDSDHNYFGAADIVFDSSAKLELAALDAAKLPDARQVILEYKDDKPAWLHVAVVMPGRPKIKAPLFAFRMNDGKRGDSFA